MLDEIIYIKLEFIYLNHYAITLMLYSDKLKFI